MFHLVEFRSNLSVYSVLRSRAVLIILKFSKPARKGWELGLMRESNRKFFSFSISSREFLSFSLKNFKILCCIDLYLNYEKLEFVEGKET